MNYTSLTYTTENRIATITLNRPDRRNVLDDVMIKELTDVLMSVNRNTQSRIVVITGAGSSFCAGMDLDYLQKFSQMGQEENLEDAHNLMKMLQLIQTLRKPVIAMVNGVALGGGCGIAAACDFVFAGKENAKLGVPEVRLGFVPAIILVYLIKRMGEGAAKEFALRGDILDASTAKTKGLVTEVVADDLLKAGVNEFAEKLAKTTSPSSLTLTKDLFNKFNEMNMKDAMEYAANLNALVRKTEDFKKGVDSFLKKEKLEW
ncbi:MAG: enoyl-CoA hydratase-related protein [Bacteroidota bacterium]|nr:enoyl-CoA hydratase-related protein [Bacteroidota bacterium]